MGIMNSRASPQGGGWFASDNRYYRKQKWGSGKPRCGNCGGIPLIWQAKKKEKGVW